MTGGHNLGTKSWPSMGKIFPTWGRTLSTEFCRYNDNACRSSQGTRLFRTMCTVFSLVWLDQFETVESKTNVIHTSCRTDVYYFIN